MNINEMPKEITVRLIPQMHIEFGFMHFSEEHVVDGDALIADGYVQIGDPVEVTFSIKTDNTKEQVVNNLRQKVAKIRAESERECMRIEEKIQSLLALPSGEAA